MLAAFVSALEFASNCSASGVRLTLIKVEAESRTDLQYAARTHRLTMKPPTEWQGGTRSPVGPRWVA